MRTLIAAIVLSLLPAAAAAAGHGPLFGGATPTLGKRGWQLDQVWMGRVGERGGDDEHMLRTMISFGITEDLQISASMPIPLQTSVYMPMGRMMSLMSSEREFESIVSWRFHRRPTTGGGRLESTVIGGFTVPLQKFAPDGMLTAPSFNVGAATGYASRAHYVWVAGGYQRRTENDGNRMGDVRYVSAVYGYRPPFLRLDYPKPDLRFFVEAVGEHTEMARHFGFDLLYTGSRAVFAGPTALLLYKAYALQAGVLLPVYQRTNGLPNEQFRFGVNVSYFFWFK
jgi:hypothetical protein